jgi:hypothetical protein
MRGSVSLVRASERLLNSSTVGFRYFSAIGQTAPLEAVRQVLRQISRDERLLDELIISEHSPRADSRAKIDVAAVPQLHRSLVSGSRGADGRLRE